MSKKWDKLSYPQPFWQKDAHFYDEYAALYSYLARLSGETRRIWDECVASMPSHGALYGAVYGCRHGTDGGRRTLAVAR